MQLFHKVGIILAMSEELEAIKSTLSEWEVLRDTPYLGMKSRIGGKQLYVMNSGIGKVNAAAACTLLIAQYAPEIIVNIGIAGSVVSELRSGDVLVSDQCVYYDVDATVFGYQHGQVPRMPTHYESLWREVEKKNHPDFRVEKGMLCTGDSFLSSSHPVEKVKQYFSNIMAIDMEGAAIGQICYQFGVPFLMIKGISDHVNEHSPKDSEKNVLVAMEHAVKLLIALCE